MINKRKVRRIILFITIIAILATASFVILKNLWNNIVFFYTPTEILDDPNKGLSKNLRLGGLIKPGTVKRYHKDPDVITEFILTDCHNEVKVKYNKQLPNLFKEKQGMVALGRFNKDNIFIASELLAKHDERYVPPNIAKTENMDNFCKTLKK